MPFISSSVFMGPKQGEKKTDGRTLEKEGKKYRHQILSSHCSWNISLSEHSTNIIQCLFVPQKTFIPSFPQLCYLQLTSSLEIVGSRVLKFLVL